VIGRDARCDFRIDDASVAPRHAEVVLLADGRCHLTDRGSPGGTYVLRDGQWRALRQDFVAPEELLKFGACELPAAELGVLRDATGTPPRAGTRSPGAAGASAQARLVRDPMTGEILEQP